MENKSHIVFTSQMHMSSDPEKPILGNYPTDVPLVTR